jgi:predicted negative regulator of RcsB-dependent stress response
VKHKRNPALMWLLIAAAVLIGFAYWSYKKNKANSTASSVVQGASPNTVLPDTATTSTPSGDTSWNHGYASLNQQNTVSQALPGSPNVSAWPMVPATGQGIVYIGGNK